MTVRAPQAAAGFRIRSVKEDGVTWVLLQDVAAYYGMRFQRLSKGARLYSRYSDIRFTFDKRGSRINGVNVFLSHAPRAWRGKVPVVSADDFRLLLDPILRCRALPEANPRIVVIDPGHGGRDTGAIARDGTREKDVVLPIARKVAERLRRSGLVVYLTRSSDVFVSLDQRVAAARKRKADLFVSIHANASGAKSIAGAETFLLTPKGTRSTYSNKKQVQASSGNGFDKNNARLAWEIQKQIVAASGCTDRGVKHARFLVLRKAPCPAVLVETGFLTNSREARLLRSEGYRDKIARGVAEGILRYIRCVRRR